MKIIRLYICSSDTVVEKSTHDASESKHRRSYSVNKVVINATGKDKKAGNKWEGRMLTIAWVGCR